MRNAKHWLATIAALLCSMTVSAHDFEVDGIYYNITSDTDMTVEITYQGDSYWSYENEYSGNITISPSVTYGGNTYSVTSIGDYAFSDCSSLISITIPESVTSIEPWAFWCCSSLTSVTIPRSVTSIRYCAFRNCSSLTSITIPESVTSIGEAAFFECWGLTAVHISSMEAWYNIDFGDSSANPLDYALYLNGKLVTELTIPNTVTAIKDCAFSGCSSLTSITIPEGVTSIGSYAFSDCGLASITIPKSVTIIGHYAFKGCSGLTSVTIPESVTSIGERAFRDCSKLTSINIPKGITEIGYEAFEGCDELAQVTFDCANVGSWFSGKSSIKEVILGENVKTIGDYAFSGCSDITSITIPEGVTSMGYGAFSNCSKLISINIPKGITEIGYEAFEGCDNLAQITIDCTNIGSWFSGKSSIKEVILGENVKTIGDYAFSGCSGITSINIPEGVTSIGYEAFNGCESLAAVHINNLEAWCKITFGGDGWHDSNSNPLSYAHNLYLNGDLVTELIIPEGVTSIRSQAFSGCTNITSVSIPESMTSIENEAFIGCENLAEVHINSLEAWCNIDFGSNPLSYAKNLYLNGELVTDLVIPSTITSIKSYAFKNCQNLTSVVIPEGVTSIGSSAFEGCSGITSINIPEGVTSIGGSALSSCSSLTSITIPGSVTSIDWAVFSGCNSLTSVTIHEGVTELDYYTFNECNSLISITLPESITSLNGQVFEDCSNLTAVTILGSLTQVDGEPFRGCNNLKEMIFGEKVRKIEAGAFAEVESLEKITVYATQPPRPDGDIFSDEVYDNATLYVPQGCISKYQVMTGWSGFYNISEIEGGTPDYLTICQADNGAVKIAVDLGRTYRVQIEPTEGWTIHSVTINGTDMTDQLDENYTFTTPTLTGSTVLNVAYEQAASKVEETHSHTIKVRGHEGIIFIEGTEQGDRIVIYTTDGTAVAETQAEGSTTEIAVESGQLYMVQIANKVVKILM